MSRCFLLGSPTMPRLGLVCTLLSAQQMGPRLGRPSLELCCVVPPLSLGLVPYIMRNLGGIKCCLWRLQILGTVQTGRRGPSCQHDCILPCTPGQRKQKMRTGLFHTAQPGDLLWGQDHLIGHPQGPVPRSLAKRPKDSVLSLPGPLGSTQQFFTKQLPRPPPELCPKPRRIRFLGEGSPPRGGEGKLPEAGSLLARNTRRNFEHIVGAQ